MLLKMLPLLKITQTCNYFIPLAKLCALKLEFWRMMWHEMRLDKSEFKYIEKLMYNCFHVSCQMSCRICMVRVFSEKPEGISHLVKSDKFRPMKFVLFCLFVYMLLKKSGSVVFCN